MPLTESNDQKDKVIAAAKRYRQVVRLQLEEHDPERYEEEGAAWLALEEALDELEE